MRDPWRSINGTRGVRCILGEGEKPVPVEHGFVEELYTRWDGGEFKEKPVDLARVHAGDYARVNSGSFAGLVGRCLEARATKIKLSLNVFGGAVAVTFNSGAVVPVAA